MSTLSRAELLAHEDFFSRPQVYQQQIFLAEMPAGEEGAHGVVFDAARQLAYCTCTLRPKPCIHAQALTGLAARPAAGFFHAADDLPDWARALLDNRSSGRVKASRVPEQSVSRRRLECLERSAEGLAELETWLADTLRLGLASVISEDPSAFTRIATRLADASLTGLSRLFRQMSELSLSSPAGWEETVLAGMADSYLALRAFEQRDTLPEPLLYDLQTFLGLTIKKEEVLASAERVRDAWAVLGQAEETVEDKLQSRRTWLFGGRSGRYALLLDYAFGGTGFAPGLAPGQVIDATLAYYPSAWPLRALVSGDVTVLDRKVEKMPGFPAFEPFAASYARALGTQPWLGLFPAGFTAVTPLLHQDTFWLLDKENRLLPIRLSERESWKLLALGAGRPLGIFGEWNGHYFRPLSAATEGRVVGILGY